MKKTMRKGAGRPEAGSGVFGRLADLYWRMTAAYEQTAKAAGLTCAGCPHNCCATFFQHHTHVEWIYLWKGLNALPEARRAEYRRRAVAYVAEARPLLAAGKAPAIMCPLNDGGLCGLYSHRMMICRLHGTRNTLAAPDGSSRTFAGCARFTSLPVVSTGQEEAIPCLDRTPFYRELAGLEKDFLARLGRSLPKVDLTLAEMILLGPPALR